MAQYVEGFEPLEAPAQGEYTPGFEPQSAQQAQPESSGIMARIIDAVNSGLASARSAAQPAANNLVRAPYEILTGQRPMLTGASAPAEYQTPPPSNLGKLLANVVNPVPGNLTQAGALVGSVATGGAGAIPRILGAAGGAGAGSAISGNPPGTIAGDTALSGAGAIGAEGLSAGISKLIRSLPNNPLIGGKRNIANDDAANYGLHLEQNSPALAGARSGEDLRQIASTGPRLLGEAKERVVQQIEQITGNTPFPMPSLGGATMTLRQANDELSAVGARAFSRDPLMRNFNGIDQRRLYGQITTDIEAGLQGQNPLAADLFQRVQGETSRGMTLLKPLQSPTAYRNDPTGVQFNTPEIQKFISSPRGEALLRNKLGDQGYEQLRNSMLRGGAPGSQDRLTASPGGVLDAGADIARRGGGFGTTALLPIRSILPNLGSSYAGTSPYTLPRLLQTGADVMGSQQLLRLPQPQ